MADIDLVEVAPGGDVVFTLSSETDSNTITQLRISSTVMSLASPVFKAMLERNFREATTLAAKGFVEIPLPEDPARTMIFLCKVLHMDKEAVKEPYPCIEDLLSLAFLVDKYDCAATIAHSAFWWLTNWRATKSIPNPPDETVPWKQTFYELHIDNLLVAAYLLRQERMFLDIAQDLVMYSFCNQPIKKTKAAEDAGIGPLYDTIEKRRDAAILAAYECIEDSMPTGFSDGPSERGCDHNSECRYEADATLAYIRMMVNRQIWPLEDVRHGMVSDIEEKMREFFLEWPDHVKPCSEQCAAKEFISCNHDSQPKFKAAADGIINALHGLCMTCVRQGDYTLTDGCEHSSTA